MIVHQIHAVILQKKASLPPAKSGSFSPKSGSFLSFFARPRAIALGSKPLAGSSVLSHSACRPGDEAGSIVCVLWFVGEEVTRFTVILSSWGSESGWCFPRVRFFSLMTDAINSSEMVIKCAQITTIVNCRFVESPNSQRFQASYVCNYFILSLYICCIKTE